MKLETTGNGVARLNPNLYADGKGVKHKKNPSSLQLLPDFPSFLAPSYVVVAHFSPGCPSFCPSMITPLVPSFFGHVIS